MVRRTHRVPEVQHGLGRVVGPRLGRVGRDVVGEEATGAAHSKVEDQVELREKKLDDTRNELVCC